MTSIRLISNHAQHYRKATVVLAIVSQISLNLVVVVAGLSDVWTAGHRANHTDGASPFVWRKLTVRNYTELPFSFTYWDNYGPGYYASSYCVSMDQSDDYAWQGYSCRSQLRALCEIDIV